MLIKEFSMEMDLKPLGLSYMASAPGAASAVGTAPPPAAAAAPPTVLLVNAAGKWWISRCTRWNSYQLLPGATPLGPEPQRMTCPSCHNVMQTRLELRSNKNTHLIALVLCVTGWVSWYMIYPYYTFISHLYFPLLSLLLSSLICLVPLPYCLKSCRSLYHYCSCCNQYLGKAAN